MSFVDENLMPNETVVYRVRLHWSTFLPAAFTFVLALFATYHNMRVFDGILYLVAAALIVAALINYLSSEFAVTNKRVIVKVGLLSRNSYELLLNRIEGIEVEQSILGRLLGFGTIIVRGTGGSKEIFYKIENPIQFRRKVQEQIAEIVSPTSQT